MFTRQSNHEHELVQAYEQVHDKKGIAYVLLWACKVEDCRYQEAFELTREKPDESIINISQLKEK